MLTETVEKAALRVDGVVWALPRPARHHILINAWNDAHFANGEAGRIPDHEQGFVTSEGRFVDRATAADLAYRAGQIGRKKRSLFSEDLW